MISRQIPNVVVWLLLLTMPYWLPAIGGYTELGTRVVDGCRDKVGPLHAASKDRALSIRGVRQRDRDFPPRYAYERSGLVLAASLAGWTERLRISMASG